MPRISLPSRAPPCLSTPCRSRQGIRIKKAASPMPTAPGRKEDQKPAGKVEAVTTAARPWTRRDITQLYSSCCIRRGPSPGNDRWLFPKWKTPRLVVAAGQGVECMEAVVLVRRCRSLADLGKIFPVSLSGENDAAHDDTGETEVPFFTKGDTLAAGKAFFHADKDRIPEHAIQEKTDFLAGNKVDDSPCPIKCFFAEIFSRALAFT